LEEGIDHSGQEEGEEAEQPSESPLQNPLQEDELAQILANMGEYVQATAHSIPISRQDNHRKTLLIVRVHLRR